jgi:hypothetical protein
MSKEDNNIPEPSLTSGNQEIIFSSLTENNNIRQDHDKEHQAEEEEEIWIPLSMEGVNTTEQQHRSMGDLHPFSAPAKLPIISVAGKTSTNNNNDNNNTSSSNSSSRSSSNLQQLQSRLESKLSIQNNLVNHPIDLFCKRFLVHFLYEIWNLEVRVRLGLVLLGLGLLARLFVWSFWYMLYPRLALLSLVLLASVIYLDPLEVKQQVKIMGEVLFQPEKAIQAIEKLNVNHIRKLAGILFLFPTLLEIRTLLFLSQISAEIESLSYSIGIGSLLLGVMLFLFQYKRIKPRDATYQGMLIAYGSALLVSISMFNMRRMPFLAAPFLTATGTLLLTYQDDDMEWMSRVVRHALRLGLKDVLTSVGSRVSEDEMLQLAILRWISDFWANNPGMPSSTTSSSSSPNKTQQESLSQQSSTESSHATMSTTTPSTNNNSTTVSSSRIPITQTSNPPSSLPQRDVQWEELLPMLNVEIDHMEVEAETLQFGSLNQQLSPPSYCATSQQQSNNFDAFEDLKAMLLSLNIDERAKPAVESYRRTVESFPPPKRWSVLLSILRRCPALLTLVVQVLLGEIKHLVASIMFLMPFVVMEYFRILQWIVSCQEVVNVAGEVAGSDQESDWTVPTGLKNVDTMTILLCGDNHSAFRPPTLLRVWHNIVSSVSALEVGLTAARCAETSAVAADFAGNVMSLVQFGFEVAEHGLLHGLAVLVREAISTGGDFSNLDRMDDGSIRYTKAAVHAVQSGHRVARNMQALSEDEHVGAFVQPVLQALAALTGHGWLSGKEDPIPKQNDSPGVVIEEINEEVDLDQESKQKSDDMDTNNINAAEVGPISSGTTGDNDDNDNEIVDLPPNLVAKVLQDNTDGVAASTTLPLDELGNGNGLHCL